MANVMILSAGYGTRLRPLTEERPKPLVPLGDRPLIVHIGERLAREGFEQIVINVHHLSEEFDSVLSSYDGFFRVSHEPRILGTAGGIARARRYFEPEPLIVWNGDTIARPPIDLLLDALARSPLALAVASRPVGQGTVGVGPSAELVRVRGETFGREVAGGDYIGVAALSVPCWSRLPEQGCLIGDVVLPRLRAGERLLTVPIVGAWRDVGSIVEYHRANLDWLRERTDDEGFWTGPGARIESGVRLRESLIGAGARVTGAGTLDRVVVWPGARIAAPLADAVVTTGGRLVRVPLGAARGDAS